MKVIMAVSMIFVLLNIVLIAYLLTLFCILTSFYNNNKKSIVNIGTNDAIDRLSKRSIMFRLWFSIPMVRKGIKKRTKYSIKRTILWLRRKMIVSIIIKIATIFLLLVIFVISYDSYKTLKILPMVLEYYQNEEEEKEEELEQAGWVWDEAQGKMISTGVELKGQTVKGNATGIYAVQLDDGTYYWYHQTSKLCGCSNCGDWTNMSWGSRDVTKFGKNGCAVYSLAMLYSNLVGKEITPRKVLEDLGCTLSLKEDGTIYCNTETSNAFRDRNISRDIAINSLSSIYNVKCAKVDNDSASIDEILNKGGYVWTSWGGTFDWYSGAGHFMVIRKATETSYYCFTSCKGPIGKGVSGKDGVILTMNTPVDKQKVISLMKHQAYGVWCDTPIVGNITSDNINGEVVDTIGTNIEVYNCMSYDYGTFVDARKSFETKGVSNYTNWAINEYRAGSTAWEKNSNITKYIDGVQLIDGTLFDKDKRILVAVGPAVMNPSRDSIKKADAAEMRYGTNIDIVIRKDGVDYYIKATVADCKAHTYPSGIIQTGYGAMNGKIYYTPPGMKDNWSTSSDFDIEKAQAYTSNGIAEFILVNNTDFTNANNYEIVGFIVY